MSWGCTYTFSRKLRLKKFFNALGVQVHPLHPLAAPMALHADFSPLVLARVVDEYIFIDIFYESITHIVIEFDYDS